jgi:hypothetical protein
MIVHYHHKTARERRIEANREREIAYSRALDARAARAATPAVDDDDTPVSPALRAWMQAKLARRS